jgi:hypothetical protein
MITTTQITVTRTGSCDGKLWDANGLGLPHNWRSAPVSVLVGFHSATNCNNRKQRREDCLLGDLDRRDAQAEVDPNPGHREGEEQQQADPGRQRTEPRANGPTDGQSGQHQDDQDPAVVDDVG